MNKILLCISLSITLFSFVSCSDEICVTEDSDNTPHTFEYNYLINNKESTDNIQKFIGVNTRSEYSGNVSIDLSDYSLNNIYRCTSSKYCLNADFVIKDNK